MREHYTPKYNCDSELDWEYSFKQNIYQLWKEPKFGDIAFILGLLIINKGTVDKAKKEIRKSGIKTPESKVNKLFNPIFLRPSNLI